MSDNITPHVPGNALSLDQAFSRLRSQGNPEPQAEPEEQTEEHEPAVEEEIKASDAEPTDQETTETPEDESQPAEEEAPAPTLKLPDGTEITPEEAVKGYLRESDYTRKTQKLSSLEKQLTSRVDNAVNQLAAVYQELQGQLEQEPDWRKLAQERPLDWQLEHLNWQQKKQAAVNARAKAEAVYREQLAQRQNAMLDELGSGSFENILPGSRKWSDPKELANDMQAIAKFAVEDIGLSIGDVQALQNSRGWVVLELARRQLELHRQKPAIKEAVKKQVAETKKATIKPGAKSTQPKVPEKLKQLGDRFKKSGDLKDAFALLSERSRLSARQ